jgi:stage V sporulation protein R
MNLFEYTKESTKTKTRYKVSEVSDEEGWKEVRDTLAEQVGLSFIPNINIVDYKPTDNALYMDCTATDDKELELEYAKETIKYVVDLVGIRTVLFATIDGKEVMIVCDTNRNVTVT